MPFDSDVVLIGTGVAPLIAASHLLSHGKSALVLNPDPDFFLEDSELPLDPMLQTPGAPLSVERLNANLAEKVIAELRPFFPGAVEFWSEGASSSGFHDPLAPHVRSRARLWPGIDESFEDLYVEASDAGLNPSILDGLPASRRFPGMSQPREGERAFLIPKLGDVDVSRYRIGLLEFIRERLGPDHVVSEASQMEMMPGGIRFHAAGATRTARVRDGMLVFWTPRLTNWVLKQAKRFEVSPRLPDGVRGWEQWSLVSRDPLDPGVVGAFSKDTLVWGEIEGRPSAEGLYSLSVLRAGPLVGLNEARRPLDGGGANWASVGSFDSLSKLCHDFLRWEKFSIRAMRPRALFEWRDTAPWSLKGRAPGENPADGVWVIPASDGPMIDVVRTARAACAKVGA